MTFLVVMEWIGTVAFAVSGALVGIEKKLDYYGVCFLAIITAIGGGIMRDVLVDRNYPAGLQTPKFAVVSVLTAVVVIIFYSKIIRLNHIVSIVDGIGLAAFTAIGAQVAVVSGHNTMYSVITMAVLTGTFGGVLRDVFAHEIPRCFKREVYAVTCIAGAVAFEVAYLYTSIGVAMYVCFGVTLLFRMLALYNNWHLGTVNKEEKEEKFLKGGQNEKSYN